MHLRFSKTKDHEVAGFFPHVLLCSPQLAVRCRGVRWRKSARIKTLTILAVSALAGVFFSVSSVGWANTAPNFSRVFTSESSRPLAVPGAGAQVLQPIGDALRSCSGGSFFGRSESLHATSLGDPWPSATHANFTERRRTQHRNEFVCAAGCAAREPQLEHSLAPWADWDTNTSGLDTLRLLWGFCTAPRQCRDPFVIIVLWHGAVHVRHCGGRYGLKDPAFYLIGPEDLSLVIIFLLAAMRVATLPPGPIAFGMYLSDYTCLLDHHLYGPGVPVFAYLTRETSWVIPFPSSFSVISTMDMDLWQAELRKKNQATPREEFLATTPWDRRTSQAYWVGAITGPWEFAADAAIMAVPRLKLLRLAKDHPESLKAEWSNLATYGISWVYDAHHISGFMSKDQPRSVENLTGIEQAGFTPLKKWANYKYYLNIDGVVMGGRMNKLLALGGVVLQHRAGYYEHFEGILEPYEHYVPIAYDLSDLVSTVKWLQDNDAEARRIAESGKRLADERLRIEDYLCYVWRAMEGLGTKTSSVEADPQEVRKTLEELEFVSATVEENSMRKTIGKFWSKVLDKPLPQLEKVIIGRRKMNKKGIEMLQWTWDKYSSLYEKAHGKR